jgi:hypothetical protein
MSTLLDLRNELQSAMGGRDDDTAVYAQNRGINAGILTYAFLHEPPELRVSGSLTVSTGGYTNMDSLTRLLRIESIYNANGNKMHRLPFHLLDHVWVPSNPRMVIYAIYGHGLYCRPAPNTPEQVTVYYLRYPERLTANTDECPFEAHEDFILAFAMHYAWMYLEEGETSDNWAKVASAMNVPEAVISKTRKALRGQIVYPSMNEEG